jgi:hypothetical protein
MKKIITILCCLATISFYAQKRELDEQLSDIDQKEVTSGIIYERVMKFGNFYNFNQSPDFNTANYDYFTQVLSEMHRASNETKFVSGDIFKQVAEQTVAANTADLAIF